VETWAAARKNPSVFVPSDGWEAVDVVEVAVAIFAIAMLEMSCHEHRMGSLSLR
jgi:hypothetical protein